MEVYDDKRLMGDRFDAYLETFVHNAQSAGDSATGVDVSDLMRRIDLVRGDLSHLLRMDVGQHHNAKVAEKVEEAIAVLEARDEIVVSASDVEPGRQYLFKVVEYCNLLVLFARTPRLR
ncbi:hypothetical protein [Streptomyces atriruber]|uniref:hypothetical protein n=1 Tax=Streptomyces atriruber TaxID=545121 RepID=UPI0006E37163|nr:hypothetical protein [Streptomyces atriruber]